MVVPIQQELLINHLRRGPQRIALVTFLLVASILLTSCVIAHPGNVGSAGGNRPSVIRSVIYPLPAAQGLTQSLPARSQNPPPDIDPVIDFGPGYGGGGGPIPCPVPRNSGPQFTLDNTSSLDPHLAQAVSGLFFCGIGFTPDQQARLTIHRSDGTRVSMYPPSYALPSDRNDVETTNLDGAVHFSPLIGAERPGRFVATVTQGQLKATAVFTITAAPSPLILVLPQIGHPGTGFRVVLGGYQPYQSARLYVYRMGSNSAGHTTGTYISRLVPIKTDRYGLAVAALVVQSDDPRGSYMVFDRRGVLDKDLGSAKEQNAGFVVN